MSRIYRSQTKDLEVKPREHLEKKTEQRIMNYINIREL